MADYPEVMAQDPTAWLPFVPKSSYVLSESGFLDQNQIEREILRSGFWSPVNSSFLESNELAELCRSPDTGLRSEWQQSKDRAISVESWMPEGFGACSGIKLL
jgi:hypothetical protein